jgi:hypothetical protein
MMVRDVVINVQVNVYHGVYAVLVVRMELTFIWAVWKIP